MNTDLVALPVTVTSAMYALPTPTLNKYWQEGLALKGYAEARALVSDADLRNWNNDQSAIKSAIKALDELRKSMTKPLREQVDAIMAAFNDVSQPLKDALEINTNKWKAFHDEQLRLAEEARAAEAVKLAAALEAGEVPDTTAPAIPEVVQSVRTGMGLTSSREHYSCTVVDPKLVPPEYWMIDEKKLNRAANAGVKVIPGVKIFRDDILVTRTR